jgi:hypothetical protein
MRRIKVPSQPQANSLQDPILKNKSTTKKRADRVAEAAREPA